MAGHLARMRLFRGGLRGKTAQVNSTPVHFPILLRAGTHHRWAAGLQAMRKEDNWLVHDHSLYEGLLYQCESAIETEEWATANGAFEELVMHLKLHMALEEEVLYPAYEATPHAPQGPTLALRDEHKQIVRLIKDMQQVIKTRDSDHVLDCLTHLQQQMVKHHEKEEDIFLPMASHILKASREEILGKLDAVEVNKAGGKWDD